MSTFKDQFNTALAAEGLRQSDNGIIRVTKKPKLVLGSDPLVGEAYEADCPSCKNIMMVEKATADTITVRCVQCEHLEVRDR
jgi:hypothetical protein